jgi:hypothetical protein
VKLKVKNPSLNTIQVSLQPTTLAVDMGYKDDEINTSYPLKIRPLTAYENFCDTTKP